jgi:hypothetical protein
MTRLIMTALAGIAILAGATTILRPHLSFYGLAGMPSAPKLEDAQKAGSTNQLPDGDFDDRSLVFSRQSKQ